MEMAVHERQSGRNSGSMGNNVSFRWKIYSLGKMGGKNELESRRKEKDHLEARSGEANPKSLE